MIVFELLRAPSFKTKQNNNNNNNKKQATTTGSDINTNETSQPYLNMPNYGNSNMYLILSN